MEIIIIGAGIAGLTAAYELGKAGKKVIILEARGRTGGRIHTSRPKGFTQDVEAGAEFIHGNLPFTLQLLKDSGGGAKPIGGSMWKKAKGRLEEQEEFVNDAGSLAEKIKELEQDMPVSEFLQRYFGTPEYEQLREDLRRFVEGYDAADVSRASTLALAGEFMEDEAQYRPKDGYGALIRYLERTCLAQGSEILLNASVGQVIWTPGQVAVELKDGRMFRASQMLITVPLGVLQATDGPDAPISFSPAIDNKIKAAQFLGFGKVIKFVLEFREAFWKNKVKDADLSGFGFIFSDAAVPTWWTQAPQDTCLLTGWLAGPDADKHSGIDSKTLLELALQSLSYIFDQPAVVLQQNLSAWHIADWGADPYALGAYAYATVNGGWAKSELATPEENTLFFAGEGVYYGPENGTVEAAIASAIQAVKLLL